MPKGRGLRIDAPDVPFGVGITIGDATADCPVPEDGRETGHEFGILADCLLQTPTSRGRRNVGFVGERRSGRIREVPSTRCILAACGLCEDKPQSSR
jgi:hypothetical protein